jgi:two-component system response regulator PilR (NtrC family)
MRRKARIVLSTLQFPQSTRFHILRKMRSPFERRASQRAASSFLSRERREDLPLLVQEILESLARRMGLSHVPTVELEAIEPLADRKWSGNVRELRNFLERGLILSNKNRITALDLQLPKSHAGQTDGNDVSVLIRLSEAGSFHEAINEAKRRVLVGSLRQSGGSIKKAAELLKVSRDSFVHHMRTLGVRK